MEQLNDLTEKIAMEGLNTTRRSFLKAVGAGAAALVTPGYAPAQNASAGQKPNILMILVDDLGYGDLSSYGAKDLQTPNTDNLIASGMRFDNFYANCPVCSPTRASLLTGRYPDLVGVPGVIRTHIKNNWGYLDPRAAMLPQLLNIPGKWLFSKASELSALGMGTQYF